MYKFISDAGHGWIEVPLYEIQKLGLTEKITPYSHQKGDMVYLEEDRDASAFVEAKWPGSSDEAMRKHFVAHDHGRNSPIRGYRQYQVPGKIWRWDQASDEPGFWDDLIAQ